MIAELNQRRFYAGFALYNGQPTIVGGMHYCDKLDFQNNGEVETLQDKGRSKIKTF